jgi:hypothetical protein
MVQFGTGAIAIGAITMFLISGPLGLGFIIGGIFGAIAGFVTKPKQKQDTTKGV